MSILIKCDECGEKGDISAQTNFYTWRERIDETDVERHFCCITCFRKFLQGKEAEIKKEKGGK